MTQPRAGDKIMAGRVPLTFEVTQDMVGGAYCALRQSVVPGQLFWPHIHAQEDQVIVVLTGELGVRVGDNEWVTSAGQVAFLPKGIPHTIWNSGTVTVGVIEISSPGSYDSYFAAVGEMTASGDLSGRPELLERYQVSGVEGWVEELGQRYGVSL